MSVSKLDVTVSRRQVGEIPEVFGLAALLLAKLRESGLAAEVRERLRLDRQSGLDGYMLCGMLMLMYLGRLGGQRALQTAATGCEPALAAAIGARKWYSQAAMSRALRAVGDKQVQDFGDWLLGPGLPVSGFERAEQSFHRDSHGSSWRIVDTDGRARAIRQRALPEGDEYPDPSRRAEALAKPGYSGRKRGEVQFHRMMVQDASTGRFLGMRQGPGGGDHRADMDYAAERAAMYSDLIEFPRSRTVLRFDGKSAGMPSLLQCSRLGIAFLTRWADYALLDEPVVRERLASAAWQPVPDSGSGPRREAMDLGWRPVVSGDLDAGSTARIVVSRYRPADAKRGCGKELGDRVYEMFATCMPEEAWPAGQLCGVAYYGRAEQENDFGALDKMLDFNHVVSWHPAGQALATVIAMFCWNLQLSWGAQLAGWRPSPVPPQALSPQWPGEGSAKDELLEAAPTPSGAAQAVANGDVVDSSPPSGPSRCEVEPKTPSPFATSCARLSPTAFEPDSRPPPLAHMSETRALWVRFSGTIIATILALLTLPQRPTRLMDWEWDERGKLLRCPAGQPAGLHRIRRQGALTHEVMFEMSSKTVCRDCPLRARCTTTANPRFRKNMTFTVKNLTDGFPEPVPEHDSSVPALTRVGEYILPCGPPPEGGPFVATAPSLFAPYLRNKPAELFAGLRVEIDLPSPPRPPRRLPWTIATQAQRQHRRATWDERLRRSTPDLLPALRLLVPAPQHTARARRLATSAANTALYG